MLLMNLRIRTGNQNKYSRRSLFWRTRPKPSDSMLGVCLLSVLLPCGMDSVLVLLKEWNLCIMWLFMLLFLLESGFRLIWFEVVYKSSKSTISSAAHDFFSHALSKLVGFAPACSKIRIISIDFI